MDDPRESVPRITLVVAAASNGVIGVDGRMPWHLPADLARFKRLTLGKPVLMGRRTHESIGRPLPDRPNLVLSRDPDYRADGCRTVRSLDEAIDVAAGMGAPELMVIGGGAVYAQALPGAQRILLTRVHAAPEGDTFFPAVDPREWQEVGRERRAADDRNPYAMDFLEFARRAPGSGG